MINKEKSKAYNELKGRFASSNQVEMTVNEYNKYASFYNELVNSSYVVKSCYGNKIYLNKTPSFDNYLADVKEENKKSNKISKKEIKQIILSAVVSAVFSSVITFLLTYFLGR